MHGSEGRCQLGATYVSVNIGSVVIGRGSTARRLQARRFYFAASVGRLPGDRRHTPARRDGRYRLRILVILDHGHEYAARRGFVALSGGRTHGRFAARLVHGGRARGIWTC